MKISSEFHSESRKPYLRFTEIKFDSDSFFIRDDSKELCVFLVSVHIPESKKNKNENAIPPSAAAVPQLGARALQGT